MPPVIEVKHLTKEYNLGTITSAKDTLRHSLARLSGKTTWSRKKFRALDDLNFTIEQGEVVGIIGHNGAGKSTLLKHLANITKPTSGEVTVHGTMAPLIEVGAGVNPELTGRENIFLNGAILGIPKKTIQTKIDDIVNFSELDKFIDTPVKRYSSGMKVKLGFSIATSMDADILIIDEVLAVGDLAFQRKCFDRMESLINQQGKTVLLVSHNIRQVTRMCSRVILLNGGKLKADGDPHTICTSFYEENNQLVLSNNKTNKTNTSENEIINLIDIAVINQEGEKTEFIDPGKAMTIQVKIELSKHLTKPEIVIGTHTTDFIYLTAASTDSQTDTTITELEKGCHTITLTHQNFPLRQGTYGIRLVIFDQNRNNIFSEENLSFFCINSDASETKKPPLRLLEVDSHWSIKQCS